MLFMNIHVWAMEVKLDSSAAQLKLVSVINHRVYFVLIFESIKCYHSYFQLRYGSVLLIWCSPWKTFPIYLIGFREMKNFKHFASDLDLSFSLILDGQHFIIENYHSRILQWRHNGRYGVSNYQHLDCLLNRLFRCRSMKTSKLRVTGLCEGNSPVNSPHKGPVTRKMSSLDDVIMKPIKRHCIAQCIGVPKK